MMDLKISDKIRIGFLAGASAIVGVCGISLSQTQAIDPPGKVQAKPKEAGAKKTAATDLEVVRARRETTLLDTIYKNAIVLITTNYVTEKSSVPAGEAFKLLFQTMKKEGWHEVRLIDGLGEPINENNVPVDDFEKMAMKEILAGKPSVESVVVTDGKRELRTLTSVPMVMDKCVLCHENYKGQKIVGALGYRLPLDIFTDSSAK